MSELSLMVAKDEVSKWPKIVKDPLWYMELVPTIQGWFEQFPSLADPQREAIKDLMYGFFEQKLEKEEIALARGDGEGENLDQFREPITLAVIHHTSTTPVSWQRLSAMGLILQYALNWHKHPEFKGIQTRDKPIWSNHFRDGKQVFYDYHWLVRQNGDYERLLEDQNVGFHASLVNPFSVGIAIDGSFWHSTPPLEAIEAIATIINLHYPQLTRKNVVGHHEVSKTNCPGDQFIDGWKGKILERLR